VIDNFMTINGVLNVCQGVPGQMYSDSCFGTVIIPNPSSAEGLPIERVLKPIPPIDVTQPLQALPPGRNNVVFALNDTGVIGGNTALWLVMFGAGRMDPILPPGPDLVVGTQCVGGIGGTLTVLVRNIGRDPSGPTTASISCSRVTPTGFGDPPCPSSPRIEVPALSGGDSVEVGSLPNVDASQCPGLDNDYCSVSFDVDNQPTSDECRQQMKRGIVCESDEDNNNSTGRLGPSPCG
jgi:hypothetical protein